MDFDLPNLWVQVDLPALLHTAQLVTVDGDKEVRPEGIAKRLNIDVEKATASLVRLHDSGYLDGIRADSLGGPYIIVQDLTERGRREVGMWPSAADGAALIEILDKAADQETDEERKGLLRQMSRSGRSVGEGVLANIVAALVTRLTLGQ